MIIPVKSDNISYDIVIGQGILKNLPKLLDITDKTLIVTDSGVPKRYAETVMNFCKNPVLFTLPEGEKSKNIKEFQHILSKMLDSGFTRSDSVIAVGGGVVGDISGFAASCYMRGIDFYNIPTTLLSQVDSSIGGKTAIDFGGIKNSVGAFYQPKKVIIDTDVLKTLSRRQLMSGLAESIKMAVTSDKQLFSLIENSENIYEDLPKIIEASILIKKQVVEDDPKESGIRRVLNFGHTVGHAIEALENGRLLHGECVALGMLPFCDIRVRECLLKVLEKYHLPTEFTKKDELIPYIRHDKKITKDGIITVFSKEIGTFEFKKMSEEEIIRLLR